MKEMVLIIACGLLLFGLVACASDDLEAPETMRVASPAFQEGGAIPKKFSCQGKNTSPALSWGKAPSGTRSFAVICDDPDAPVGTWVHWVIYNLPASLKGLPEGVPTLPTLKGGGVQGKNSWRTTGFGGPCPPHGKAHRYFFKVYALDIVLPLKPGATKAELLKAMRGHVLAKGRLMGTYKR